MNKKSQHQNIHMENTMKPTAVAIGTSHSRQQQKTKRQSKSSFSLLAMALSASVTAFSMQLSYAGSTIVTDAIGTDVLWTFEENLGVQNLTSKVNQVDGKGISQTFDANNNRISRTDEEGRTTTYTYNATNQRISMTEAVGTPQARTTTYDYVNPDIDLVTRTTMPSVNTGSLKETINVYDAELNITSTTVNGFTVSGSPVSRGTSFAYNDRGQVIEIDGPRADVSDITTFHYYDCNTGAECGQLQSVVNALGHATTYDSYDANARLLQSTDANDVVTTNTYHPRGWLLSRTQTAPDGEVRPTSYQYDNVGQLIQITSPDGIVLNYEYDVAHDLRAITDNLGNRVEYEYDAKGNRTKERTFDPTTGLVRDINRDYDIRNFVESIRAASSITTLVNDAVGNVASQTDPNQNPSTSSQYDALDRLETTLDALTNTIGYQYNVADQLIQVQAPNGAITDYDYDDLGNLLAEHSADRGQTIYNHDIAGNVSSQTDARGITVSYQYDALNRLTGVTFPDASENVSYQYDTCPILGIGRLCAVSHEAGSEAYAYDSWGNVVMHLREEQGVDLTQAQSYNIQYVYDTGNRVIQTIYPSGRTVDYTRDAIGRLVEVSSTSAEGEQTPLLFDRQYRADGLWTSQVYGNGLSQSKQYDTQGRLENHVAGDYNRGYGYDNNGNILDIQGSLNSLYEYDPLDRLVEDTVSDLGIDLSFDYDANGNRIQTVDNGVASTLAYQANSNRLTDVAAEDVVTGPAGRTLVDQKGRFYVYNDAGRLEEIGIVSSNETIVTYHYNANQLRTRKTVNGNTTLYHYDLAGNMLAESDEAGFYINEYVYADGERIAVFAAPTDNASTVYAEIDLTSHTTYAGGQDQASTGAVTATVDSISLTGNRWRASPLNYTVTENTVLEFDFSSSQRGEIHGIGLDNNVGLTGGNLFQLYGSQSYGNPAYRTYTAGSGTQHFKIRVGEYYQGDMNYVFFAMDDDANKAGNSEFTNVRLYESTPQAEQVVDLNAVQPYGGSQDGQGTVAVITDGGVDALRMQGNRWQKIGVSATIKPTTRLEFEFKSSAQGEIHGIGFDDDDGISAHTLFQLYGTQTWGLQAFDTYSSSDNGGYKSYSIPVGEYFTGNFPYLTLVMDHDSGATGESVFRNVKLVDPSVVINTETKVYYYVNDHLQTPQRLVDEGNQVSWEATYEAFGEATVTTENVKQNHRFPGQYYDEESGLHYNWNRYYEPSTGRYVTSDPIGLYGGLNTFGYVDGNPLRFTDTKGLYKDLLECLMDDVASAEECFWTPDAPTVRYLKAAATAAGECIACTISCGANFLFGTDLPLAGEAYTQAAQRSLEAAAKKKASALAAAGVKFVAKRVFLPLTIASAADAAVCTAECF